jgi:hypothetical protein
LDGQNYELVKKIEMGAKISQLEMRGPKLRFGQNRGTKTAFKPKVKIVISWHES